MKLAFAHWGALHFLGYTEKVKAMSQRRVALTVSVRFNLLPFWGVFFDTLKMCMQYICSHVIELKKGALPPLGISMENDWTLLDLGIDGGDYETWNIFPCWLFWIRRSPAMLRPPFVRSGPFFTSGPPFEYLCIHLCLAIEFVESNQKFLL